MNTVDVRMRSMNIFIADSSHMGCQLMAAGLRRSRNRLVVAGSSTTSEGVRAAYLSPVCEIDAIVIACDLKEGPMSGLKVASEVRMSHPETRIIALLDSCEREMVVEAFRSGATGILSREQPFDILCKCIIGVCQGEVWASSKELKYALDALVDAKEVAKRIKQDKSYKERTLTSREESIVQLIAEGLTNRDISAQLKLSENTVRNYLFRIFNKLGTSNRLELALFALKRKRTDEEESQGKLLSQEQRNQREGFR
jgi:two-component system, NarL family, nitrate/nitrite response regulator NarL